MRHGQPADKMVQRIRRVIRTPAVGWASPGPSGPIAYSAHRAKTGFGLMFGAGTISGLLGIGSGALKVIAMDQAMRIPFKVSTTTSNFMIGVTAAAGAGIYLSRGYIDPGLAMPVMLGVLAGSLLGARHLMGASTHLLRLVFGLVVAAMAIETIFNGITGEFKRGCALRKTIRRPHREPIARWRDFIGGGGFDGRHLLPCQSRP